MKKKTNILV